VAISTDGKGRWVDNVFVERLWRSVKYEEVYLHAYASPKDVDQALRRYFAFYNARRPHQALDQCSPDAVYFASSGQKLAA
jgi:putative transposase